MTLREIGNRVRESGIVVLRGPAGDSPVKIGPRGIELVTGSVSATYGGSLHEVIREAAVNAGLLPGESTRPRGKDGHPLVPYGWRWDVARAEMLVTEVEE